MPRVYTTKARKDYPAQGIRKGDTYYQWCKRPGGRGKGITYKSLTRPTRAQLTSSSFLSTVYDVYDAQIAKAETPDDLREAAQALRDAGEEAQSSLDNMPDSLQSAPSGEMLQTRVDSCESAADEIEQAADELESKLTDIEAAEQAWADYSAAMETWIENRPDGLESVETDCEYEADDRPEEVEDDSEWRDWVASRPEAPSEDEEDWDDARTAALEEAREACSDEPDWG